jgi:SNF2 family DNA or RNA helicase
MENTNIFTGSVQLDNLTNTIYLIDHIEIHPYNTDKIYKMDYLNIMKILLNRSYNLTFDDLEKTYNINTKVDLKFVIKDTFILKNDDAFKYLNKFNYRSDYHLIVNQTMLKKEILDYFVINHFDGKFSYFMIVVGIDTEQIKEEFYENLKNYKTFEHDNRLFAMYLLTLMKYHFEEINNLRNNSSENSKISSIICNNTKNYTQHKMITQQLFLKTQLYMYQRANVYWMIDREINNNKYILDNDIIINWGPNKQFNLKTLNFEPKRLATNYPEENFNSFKGGCLCDDVGLGKTVQIFTLCLLKPSKNLILVPKHLYSHWIKEYEKHVNIEYNTNNILITTFDKMNSEILNDEYDRLIVDEYHEVVLKSEIYDKINEIKTKYKWAVTATPFINNDMIYNIVNFIAKNKLESKKIAKYKMYLEVFSEMFRKNTKLNITQEVKLPPVKEITYYLTLSNRERLYYDTLIDSKGICFDLMKRYFCINPNLYFTERKIKSKFNEISLLDENIKEIHKETLDKEVEFLDKLKEESLTSIAKTIYSELDITEKYRIAKENGLLINNRIREVEEQEKKVDNIKKTITYFNTKIDEINKNKEVVVENNIEYVKVSLADNCCQICYSSIDSNIALLQCGHLYCKTCVKSMISSNIGRCPVCRTLLKNSNIYLMKPMNEKPIDLVQKYGTKIANLIQICKNTKGKIVLYSHTETLISNVANILNKNYIKTKIIHHELVENFEKDEVKVLVVSSINNASGLDLTCASTIIILEPLKENYIMRKQIENQIVGRLHRIGQQNEVSFIRLIVKDTIEQKINIENKLYDSINEENELEMNYDKKTIEV